MRTEGILLVLGTVLFPVLAAAAATEGPAAADQILRQNPQIRTIAGIPGNLKGVSVQDCPPGGKVDLSRSRCVVAHAPQTARAFILVLHPASTSVWGVFERDAAGQTHLLAEYDTGGNAISSRGGVPARKKQTSRQDAAGQASGAAAGRQGDAVTLDDRLLGNWKGVAGSTLEISASTIKFRTQVGDQGVYTMHTSTHKWSPLQDRLRKFPLPSGQQSDLLFSTSQQSRSKEDVLRKFRAYKEQYKDPPFQAMKKGEISKMEAAIATATPANYPVLLLYSNGEVSELIFDGQNIWMHIVMNEALSELFTRVSTK